MQAWGNLSTRVLAMRTRNTGVNPSSSMISVLLCSFTYYGFMSHAKDRAIWNLKNLAQGHKYIVPRPGLEPTLSWSEIQELGTMLLTIRHNMQSMRKLCTWGNSAIQWKPKRDHWHQKYEQPSNHKYVFKEKIFNSEYPESTLTLFCYHLKFLSTNYSI